MLKFRNIPAVTSLQIRQFGDQQRQSATINQGALTH